MSASAVHNRGECTVGFALSFLFLIYIVFYVTFPDDEFKHRPPLSAIRYLHQISWAPQWISVPNHINFTSTLLARWRRPTLRPCQLSHTASSISISGLDSLKFPIKLPTGIIHEFVITTFDELGLPRCSGGDYFEIDLSGHSWKSRPPITDHDDGSYTFKMQVDPAFFGNYNLTVILLYRSYDGLKWQEGLADGRELRKVPITFYDNKMMPLPKIKQCGIKDFDLDVWSGRWTRLAKNDTCDIDYYGRYHCLHPSIQCQEPWCHGLLAPLESNGWVYSAHCSFRIFTQESAWKCLANKWLFFWGDSNHMDTIRNLLNFVLGMVPEVQQIPRRIDDRFVNPNNVSESVRITSIFNGHWNESMNHLGLQSLRNKWFRSFISKYFDEDRYPDAMILNSGLHDGTFWKDIEKFAEGAEYAAEFWDGIMKHVKEKARNPPRVFYRSTVAPGGIARGTLLNPSKMEVYNGVLLEKFRQKGLINGGVIDAFDMTFPWHYDNRCSDGPHYGRRPANKRWKDGQIGHHYFVDLMLSHVLLNAICNG